MTTSRARYFRVAGLLTKTAFFSAATYAVVKDHVIDFTSINGRSMSPTLSPTVHETGERDWILWWLWRPAQNLKRGDLVLFHSPRDPKVIAVKRVVAMGGDTVVLNPRREPGYGIPVQDLDIVQLKSREHWHTHKGKLLIPYGHIWVEGDNVAESRDSNDYGPISKSLLLGVAWVGLSPLSILFAKPWEGYKSKTKVIHGQEELPPEWYDL